MKKLSKKVLALIIIGSTLSTVGIIFFGINVYENSVFMLGDYLEGESFYFNGLKYTPYIKTSNYLLYNDLAWIIPNAFTINSPFGVDIVIVDDVPGAGTWNLDANAAQMAFLKALGPFVALYFFQNVKVGVNLWNVDTARNISGHLIFEENIFAYPYRRYTRQELLFMQSMVNETKGNELYPEFKEQQEEDFEKFVYTQEYASVGELAPDFELNNTDHSMTFNLSQNRGKIVAFIFCSITCTCSNVTRPKWRALYDQYRYNENVTIFTIYGHDRHPGESPAFEGYVHPVDNATKWAYASQVQAMDCTPVYVDPVMGATYWNNSGPVQKAYGEVANPCFVIDKEGTLVYRTTWVYPPEIGQVIETLLEWYGS